MVAKATGILVLVGILTGCAGLKPSPIPQVAKAQLQVRWVKPTVDEKFFKTHRKINRMTPVLADPYVIQGNNLEDLVAVDRVTSRLIWRKHFKGGVEAGAVVFKDRVYVTANDGTVSALNLKTGESLWTFTTSSENVSAPILDTQSGMLYFQSAQNIVFCVDAENGRQVWIYTKLDNNLLSIRGAATPLIHEGNIYVGFSEGTFTALNAKTGQLIWEHNLNRNKRFRDIDAKAVPYRNAIIISGYDDRIYSLERSTGKIQWSHNAGSYSAATLVGEQIYVSTTDSRLLKLNANNGALIWSQAGLNGIATQVSTLKGLVVFGESQGKLKVVDPQNGTLLAAFEPGRGILSKPAVDENTSSILFISGEANLYNMTLNLDVTDPFPYIP